MEDAKTSKLDPIFLYYIYRDFACELGDTCSSVIACLGKCGDATTRGTVIVAIGLGCLSWICLCRPRLYQPSPNNVRLEDLSKRPQTVQEAEYNHHLHRRKNDDFNI